MTPSEIERAVASATGESRHTIRSYGFSLLPEQPESEDDPLLPFDCPGCGATLDAAGGGNAPSSFVECPRCDALYPVALDEVLTAAVSSEPLVRCA